MAKEEKRFYVYLLEDGVVPAYVGKGSGNRLKVQERRYSLSGCIIERHSSERQCYKAERKWIATLKPYINKHPGGNGSKCKKVVEKVSREYRWVRKTGAKRAAAIILCLISRRNPHLINQSKIDIFRRVANGGG